MGYGEAATLTSSLSCVFKSTEPKESKGGKEERKRIEEKKGADEKTLVKALH